MPVAKHNLLYFIGAMLLLPGTLNAGDRGKPAHRKPHGKAANYSETPISFEPNKGQTDGRVKFMARGTGYTLYLTQEAAEFSFENREFRTARQQQKSLIMTLIGANADTKLTAKGELPTKSSYFLGTDPKKWHTGIPNYARVTVEKIYPGIDVTYEGTHGWLQCHFLVAAGARPERITLAISGAKDAHIDSEGNLVLRTDQTELRLRKATAYQTVDAKKRLVNVSYAVNKGQINFVVHEYDRTTVLSIDPVLSYGDYLALQDAALTLQELHRVRDGVNRTTRPVLP